MRLDLDDFDWPICLLEFNKALEEAECGSQLEVWVKDPDVMHTIDLIISNSASHLVTITEERDRFRIWITKS